MNQIRLNVRIEGVMADHVDGLIEQKLYNNQSEYVRDLIRHDIEKRIGGVVEAISEGKADMLAGRIFKSSGKFEDDVQMFEEKEKNGWK